MITVVGGEKGGSGKTTIATMLTAMRATGGHDVLLVNADPQPSAAYWLDQRRFYHPDAKRLMCVTVKGDKIHNELRDLEQRYGTLVVDTGGRDSPELRNALIVATRVVLPVRPEQFDLETLRKMEELVAQASVFNKQLDVRVILNQVPAQSRDAAVKEVRDWMVDNTPRLPGINAVMGFRAAYGRANAEGLAVVEMRKKDTKACSEAMRVYREAFNDGR